jgi:hypothetical protein
MSDYTPTTNEIWLYACGFDNPQLEQWLAEHEAAARGGEQA